MRRERIPDLISEINDELDLINRLVSDIREVNNAKPASLEKKKIYEESLALKVHNFYTGCERIFQKIADDINGGVPTSRDWHKRLLRIMSLEIESIRPSVISKTTAGSLENYLAFRHIVRNIYGFEIETERLQVLIDKIYGVHAKFRKEVEKFVGFLRKIV